MTEIEYKAFVNEVYSGNVIIGVDRAFARQLFTGISVKAIQEKTGEAPYIEKMIVGFTFLAGPIALLLSLILAALAIKWWAVLVIPTCLVIWVVYYSMSSRGDAGILFISVLLLGSIGVYFSGLVISKAPALLLVSFLLALWLARLLYWGSTFFLRAWVLRSYKAFVAFSEGVRIAGPRDANITLRCSRQSARDRFRFDGR